MAHFALYSSVIVLLVFVNNSKCILKSRFGMEYSRGGIFPETQEKNQKVPDIPETWKRFDSFKFDRSIEKAQANKNNVDTKNFEDRSVGGNSADYDVCMTKDCVTAAAKFIQNMDATINPCENFYDFACGAFIDNTNIPQEKAGVSTMSQMSDDITFHLNKLLSLPPEDEGKMTADEQMARDYYFSCLDEKRLDKLEYLPILEVFKDVGLRLPVFSPVRPRLWDRSEDTGISDVVRITLKTFLADSGLFGLDLSPDAEAAKNTTLLMLYQPSTFLSAEEYRDTSKNGQALRKVYKMFLLAVTHEIRDFLVKYDPADPWPSDELLDARIDVFMKSEAMIASAKQTEMTLEDSVRQVSLVDLKNLSKGVHIRDSMMHTTRSNPGSYLDFVQITQDVIKELTDFEIKDKDMLNIPHLEYFQKLGSVLSQIPEQDLEHYLTFRQMVQLAESTTSKMRDYFHVWSQVRGGSEIQKPRWHTCTKATQSKFSAKVSQLYANSNEGKKTRKETSKLIENLKSSFLDQINAADWMDTDTRSYALEKLQNTEAYDGFVGELNAEVISKVYKGLSGIVNTSYTANIVEADKWWTKKYFSYMKEPPMTSADIHNIQFDTTVVNAMYSPQGNNIWVPLGIQNPPIYQDDSIPALTYGGLGMILGHELTHGFDSTGSLFDKDGNLRNWWTNETIAEFKSKQQCFVDQYNEYSFKVFDVVPKYKGPTAVNGSTTLNENIADNGGLREAWGAYQLEKKDRNEQRLPGLTEYSTDQLFFMSFANLWCETKSIEALAGQLQSDVHSPGPVRVKATISNMQQFQDAFKCKNSDKMVKEKKCIVW